MGAYRLDAYAAEEWRSAKAEGYSRNQFGCVTGVAGRTERWARGADVQPNPPANSDGSLPKIVVQRIFRVASWPAFSRLSRQIPNGYDPCSCRQQCVASFAFGWNKLRGRRRDLYYRVVLQGHVTQGADLDQVKREFMRITALPQSVTEGLFGGTPRIIKRQMPEADAERIALTLRAIGAVATIEREQDAGPDVGPEGPATLAPLPGGDSVSMPEGPVEPVATPRRRFGLTRTHFAWLAACAFAVALVPVLAPVVDGWMQKVRGVPPIVPKPAAKAVAVEPKVEVVPPKVENLHGPWRCTNQNTGISLYWQYNEDGTLDFFGEENFAAGKRINGAGVPNGWTLQGDQVTWTYSEAESPGAVTNRLQALTLTQFDYIDTSRDPIFCRRP
jgi:hypothetical protein